MKYKNIFSAAFLAMAAFVGFNSCDTDPETEVVQDLYNTIHNILRIFALGSSRRMRSLMLTMLLIATR